MKTPTSSPDNMPEKRQMKRVFKRWIRDRNVLITVFFLSFVVWDSLLTYLGTSYLGVGEKNLVVLRILGLNNGWVIWLILKIVIALLGTAFLFLAYYAVSTSSLPKKQKDGVLLIEYCGWIYLISFNLLSVFMWSGVVLGKL